MRTVRRDRLQIREGLQGAWSAPVAASVKPVGTSERDGSDAIPTVTKFEVTVGPEVELPAPADCWLRWVTGSGDSVTYTLDGSYMPITRNGALVAIELVMKKY